MRYIRFQLSVTQLIVFLILDWHFQYLIQLILRKDFVWATYFLELDFTRPNVSQFKMVSIITAF